jgi:hypothetical protein
MSMTPHTPAHDNQLEHSGLPIFFAIANAAALGLDPPHNRHGESVRVWARSLSVMQKEAIVLSARTGRAWRLASDEGPYLDGFDAAPCPLAFLTTGMVASYATEILSLAREQALAIDDLMLVQDNHYTMEGSALQGTMTGGALPVELTVHIRANADDDVLRGLVARAVDRSPAAGLLGTQLSSLFTLTFNGRTIALDGVGAGVPPVPPDPADRFPLMSSGGVGEEPLVRRTRAVESVSGIAGGAGSSLQATQKRQLHLRGTCRLREDGVKEIQQETFSPKGSTFSFLSDETEERGGRGLAPDGATYMAAGIAFCFMTQLGRYAKILTKNLTQYYVVQDAHFSRGASGGEAGRAAQQSGCDPIETHVYLTSTEDEAFARRCLAMGEQTCFLHALCRTPLPTNLTVVRV